MAKRSKPTIGELQDEIEQRDERIKELRQEKRDADEEHTRLRDLITQLAEHVEDAGHYIERFCETFQMRMTDEGGWTWEPFWDEHWDVIKQHNELVHDHNALVRQWNSYLPVINGANEKHHRPVGRPLAAEAREVAQVQKLHKEGRSLRGIAEDTELSFATVRTIVERVEGKDRMTKERWQRLHPEEKWKEREYTPIALDRQEAAARKRQRRTGNALPKQARRLVEEGRELVKEAKR